MSSRMSCSISSCKTHHTGIVLKVQVDAVCSPPWLGLSNDNSGHDLLPQLRLSLLDGGHDHVSNTGGGQTIEAGTDTLDGDDVEISGAGVIAAIHDSSTVFNQLVLVHFATAFPMRHLRE